MQLPMHAADTCFWHQSPYLCDGNSWSKYTRRSTSTYCDTFSCGMIILYRNINMDPTWIMKKDKIARKCTNLICNSASHATEKNDKKPFPYENLILSCICLNSLRHTWVSKLTIICSDNGLSPGRRQGIIWTNAGNLCKMAMDLSRPQCIDR